ncbi:hypothetical protein CLAIMM_03394 [Cladophialophora immunda]|nr:hypothetical protein CLAIMM_03394 [Cladophialophora immunda]
MEITYDQRVANQEGPRDVNCVPCADTGYTPQLVLWMEVKSTSTVPPYAHRKNGRSANLDPDPNQTQTQSLSILSPTPPFARSYRPHSRETNILPLDHPAEQSRNRSPPYLRYKQRDLT